jgi:hypothetical protein
MLAANAKSPLTNLASAGRDSYECFRFLSVLLRRHVHRVVMVVMAMVQQSHESVMLEKNAEVVKLGISMACSNYPNRPHR